MTILISFLFVSLYGGNILANEEPVRDIGSNLQLFIDDWLIAKMEGLSLELHHPIPEEIAITFDKPWEGNTSAYVTVFEDDGIFRMYYRGSAHDQKTDEAKHPEFTCYAESKDGIHWVKPELGLFEFQGSKKNNIVWQGIGTHNFTPFKDKNPNCPLEARYKALGLGEGGLYAFQSPDGIHWKLMRDKPVLTKGAFDSQNLAFWDEVRRCYVAYYREFREGYRDIMTATSQDFLNWREPQFLDYGSAPKEHLYTNAILPYFRAPHIYLGFPKRFFPERQKRIPGGLSDGAFMTSRDGIHWHRWLEAFIRPGPQPQRWVNRNNMTAWGILVTKSKLANAPDELSLYSSESYNQEGNCLRRYTLRMDGFVSLHASYPEGEFITHPLRFKGKELVLNYSTSAGGEILVEIQKERGEPIPGFSLRDCETIYGDEIECGVRWRGGKDLSSLEGKIVRLRFVMLDADIYSLRFR